MKKREHYVSTFKSSKKRNLRARKLPLFAWICAGVSAISIAVLAIIAAMSFAATGNGRVALFYGIENYAEYNRCSLDYCMAQAGFDCVILDEDEEMTNNIYAIPQDYIDEDVVIIAAGSNSFDVVSSIEATGNTSVLGYCLIAPSYPSETLLDGWDMTSPNCDVAIFGFDSNADKTEELSDEQKLFERISGVDTLYGIPARSGGALSSDVFVSSSQTRYLSLSCINSGLGRLISGAAFQSELAGYLGDTYGDGASYSAINAYFVIRTLVLLLAIGSFALFLFFVPVPTPDKGEQNLKGKDSLALIIFLGISAWLGLCIVVGRLIPYTAHYAKYVVVFSPLVLIFGMFVLRIGFYLSRKVTYVRRVESPAAYATMAAIEGMLALVICLNFTGIMGEHKRLLTIGIALVVMLLDYTATTALALIDKKSRFAGEGPGSYYGNPLYFVETIIPGVAGLAMSFILKDMELLRFSVFGIAIALLPYLGSQTIKRSSDYFELAGLVHAFIAALLVYAVL